MALIAKQGIGLPGPNPLVMAACAGGGDTVAVDRPGIRVLFRNGDASSKTITIVDPRTTYGNANPDVAIVVTTLNMWEGILPLEFADPTTGLVTITYSAVTSCTIAAIYG